jgi:toxin HigB-1
MISSFKHKALRRYFETGDGRGLNAQHLEKIALVLGVLNVAEKIEAIDLPSFRLHPLTGDLKHHWSVTVRANWRIIFRFEDGLVFDVDLVDYH